MKYGKTYSVLLPSFPEPWRERAISYSQLKKLINGVVSELTLLGLDPAVLHDLLREDSDTVNKLNEPSHGDNFQAINASTLQSTSQKARAMSSDDIARSIQESTASSSVSTVSLHQTAQTITHVVYELATEGDRIIPRLRLTVGGRTSPVIKDFDDGSESISSLPEEDSPTSDNQSTAVPANSPTVMGGTVPILMTSDKKFVAQQNTLFALQKHVLQDHTDKGDGAESEPGTFLENIDLAVPPDHLVEETIASSTNSQEIVIPLNSDTAFYRVLVSALHSLSEHQTQVQEEFTQAVQQLSSDISNVSRPASSSKWGKKSDLHAWRQIFQMWVDAQIFESSTERNRGERSVEDAEKRLTEFANSVVEQRLGDGRTLRRKESRDALERFLQMNVLMLDLKKFQLANSEAIRKIMKKHEKRTSLMFPGNTATIETHPVLSALALSSAPRTSHGLSLPHLLVVLLTETLMPVIPSIDDYACLICTSLAYIPIRLQCRHLFCVRCLVKMQKRGQAECPLCRAPNVLQANRNNVDVALQRFMLEWFPEETKEKDKANRKEAAQEQARELGYSDKDCIVM